MRTPPLFLIVSIFGLLVSPVTAEPKTQDPADESRKSSPSESKDSAPHANTEKDPASKAPSPRKRTWLGVATAGIDSALRRHLELDEGFGIEVVEVMADSPAGKSGLRNHDIITHFEDQHLISPEHLSLLVKTKSSGDSVSMTIIRKGKEEVITITLGETDEDTFHRWHSPAGNPREYHFPPLDNRNDPEWQESIRRHQDLMREWMDRNRPDSKGGSPDREGPDGRRDEPRKPGETERTPSGSQPPSISVSPGFPLRVFGMEGVLKIDNEKGEVTLTRKEGKHHLEIKDAEGKLVYEGPFDPATGAAGLPEAARRQLEIMKLGNFEVLMPETPAANPEKTGDVEAGENSDNKGEIL